MTSAKNNSCTRRSKPSLTSRNARAAAHMGSAPVAPVLSSPIGHTGMSADWPASLKATEQQPTGSTCRLVVLNSGRNSGASFAIGHKRSPMRFESQKARRSEGRESAQWIGANPRRFSSGGVR